MNFSFKSKTNKQKKQRKGDDKNTLLPQIFADEKKHIPDTKRLKQYLARARYFSQRKAVDQPPGFMQVFLAKVSCVVH